MGNNKRIYKHCVEVGSEVIFWFALVLWISDHSSRFILDNFWRRWAISTHLVTAMGHLKVVRAIVDHLEGRMAKIGMNEDSILHVLIDLLMAMYTNSYKPP